MSDRLREALDRPIVFYTRQIALFNEIWYPFCPLVVESDLIRHMIEIQNALRLGSPPDAYGHCFQILVIMLINSCTRGQDGYRSIWHQRLQPLDLPHVAALGRFR